MIVKQLMYNVPNIIYRFYKLDGNITNNFSLPVQLLPKENF